MEHKHNFNLWLTRFEARDFRNGKIYDEEYKTTPDYLLDGEPYRSNIGAQSLFFAKLATLLKEDHGKYFYIKLFSVFLLSSFLAIIFLWMRHNFGLIPSAIGIVFLVLSTGVNIFSESLYWSVWLFVLPLAVVCLLDLFKVNNFIYIFIVVFPVFLFKFLSGYEFITTIVITAMTPYVWDFFVNKNTVALMRVLAVGISSVSAFLTSVFVYNILFLQDFNSSGIEFIFGRSGTWSLRHLDEVRMSPLTQLVKVFIMNFMDVGGYGIPLFVYLILTLTVILLMRRKITIGGIKFIIFLFFGSISWLIVQPGHILFHVRYATLIFFLPFGLFIPGFLTSLVVQEKKVNEYNV